MTTECSACLPFCRCMSVNQYSSHTGPAFSWQSCVVHKSSLKWNFYPHSFAYLTALELTVLSDFAYPPVGVKSFFNIQLRCLLASHFWSIPSTRKEKLLVNNERRKNAHFISNASEDRKTQPNKNVENRIIWVGAIPILQFCLSDQLVSQTKR